MPMQVWAHEHPFKSGARRIVRQIFLFWLVGSILTLLIWRRDILGATDAPAIIMASLVASGAIFAIPLWLFYRIIRFAIGR
jgi:hypothetical protein